MIKVSNPFSSIPPLFSDLAKSLAGEMDCSLEKIQKYSTDGSPYTIKPQAIVYPKNSTDIKHILSFAREYNMPVTVRGNGTSRTGGSLSEGIIIDTTRYFTHIRQINMQEHTITVDAGVSVKELREKLHGWRMDIPVLTEQDNDGTVGALISKKSVNPTSFHNGTIREWVEALTVTVDSGEEHRIADGITPSGRLLGIYQSIFPILTQHGPILRAVKPETSDDATGYCLWNTSIGPRQLLDQLVGSEGTLGIITSVTLRIVPHKPHTRTVCIPISDKKQISLYVDIAKHHTASHIFLYDSTFMELTDRYKLNSIPSFPDAKYTLCVSFFGNTKEELSSTMNSYVRALSAPENNFIYYDDRSFIGKVTDPEFLFSLLESYTQGSHIPVTVCDGIIVPIHKYEKMLEELEDYLYSTGKLYVITGNSGSGHLSAITLFDPRSRTHEHELNEYTQTIFTLVKKNKGGISSKNGDGLSRTPYIPFIYNEATMVVFEEIKNAWDPSLILNPGKKMGVTPSYLNNHLTMVVGR
ncbi:FAD-binding oxidoreductase [Candidatus Gracilibacteria bacterium]|nr:FAD-binding oxidoreductase [Candidatus Gracilibacteria bacterium]